MTQIADLGKPLNCAKNLRGKFDQSKCKFCKILNVTDLFQVSSQKFAMGEGCFEGLGAEYPPLENFAKIT